MTKFNKESMHTFCNHSIRADEGFIKDVAERYLSQRSETRFDLSKLDESNIFSETGFSHKDLEKVIKRNSPPTRIATETEARFRDIYRSDLGELLMTTYFEEKLPEKERFIIPHKNISNRELAELPGRGLDAIGYNKSAKAIQLLLGEAKVSEQRKNPPDVVHTKRDSIYKTQKKHHSNKEYLLKRLTDFVRKLDTEDATHIGAIIMFIESGQDAHYQIVYGCFLVRDVDCVNKEKDWSYPVYWTT